MIKLACREIHGATVVDERLSEGGNITGLMLELADGSRITVDV
jgi:hypothetical protein